MELYINNGWTERYTNAYIAEAIACSEKRQPRHDLHRGPNPRGGGGKTHGHVA